MMEKCIYFKNSVCDLTYTTAEHIIPKCIGGIMCLQVGYVSDQANELFSPLELHFARNNPLIAIPRMFEQNTGRKKHKNREQITVSIDETGQPLLAYLKEGKPICISQVIVDLQKTNSNDDNKRTSQIRLMQSKTNDTDGLIEFIDGLEKFDNFSLLTSKQIKTNQIIIGFKEERCYVAINSDRQIDTIPAVVHHCLESIKNNTNTIIKKNEDGATLTKLKITMDYTYIMNIAIVERVIAKIAFNVAAYLFGQDYMLQDEFDDIREAIIENKNLNRFVSFESNNPKTKQIYKILSVHKHCSENAHMVVIKSVNNQLLAFVFLFGENNVTAVKLSENIKERVDLTFFICDWKNKREYTHNEFFQEFFN